MSVPLDGPEMAVERRAHASAHTDQGDTPVTSSAPSCEKSLNWDGLPPYCGEPATVRIDDGCIHEHITVTYACWSCLSDARKICGDDEWLCTPCSDGPDPHKCPVLMQVTELEPP